MLRNNVKRHQPGLEHYMFRLYVVKKTTCTFDDICGKRIGLVPMLFRTYNTQVRRGRLVAYGARLESELGASPREFESLSLRQQLFKQPT